MHLQSLIVALLVIGCALHATWRLIPAALRRSLAARVFHRELPPAAGCGSGCDGCASTPNADAPARGTTRPIAFHPRRPR